METQFCPSSSAGRCILCGGHVPAGTGWLKRTVPKGEFSPHSLRCGPCTADEMERYLPTKRRRNG